MRPFAVMDCALVTLAAGRRAQNLRELRDHLREVDAGSIRHHFWGSLLRPSFDEPEFGNDFARWAASALHDRSLAERLAMVDPAAFADSDGLRREVLDIVDERLDEREHVPWSPPDRQFHFLTSRMVVFDTRRRVHGPRELGHALPELSLGSVYYHFIDARLRPPLGQDDFSVWLAGAGEATALMVRALGGLDPFFAGLSETRRRLSALFADLSGEGAS